MRKPSLISAAFLGLCMLSACGGGGMNLGTPPPPPQHGDGLAIASGAPPEGTLDVKYDGRLGPSCTKGDGHCVCIYINPLGYSCHVAEYGFPLGAVGGVAPYAWNWSADTSSTLPPGLEITNVYGPLSSGDCCGYSIGIGGTPSATGTYDVLVTVTDSASPPTEFSAKYTIAIAAPTATANSAEPASSGVHCHQ